MWKETFSYLGTTSIILLDKIMAFKERNHFILFPNKLPIPLYYLSINWINLEQLHFIYILEIKIYISYTAKIERGNLATDLNVLKN